MTKNDHLHTFFMPFCVYNLFVYILKVKIQKIVCKIRHQNAEKQKKSPPKHTIHKKNRLYQQFSAKNYILTPPKSDFSM